MTDYYENYFNQFYIPPQLSPKMKAQRLQELEEEKLQGYEKALHPEVLKQYKNFHYVLTDWVPSAQDEQIKRFYETVALAKNPIVKEITQVYRLKNGNKEMFYYQEEVKSKAKNGSPISFFHTVGKYSFPEFEPSFDMGDSPEPSGFNVGSVVTKYELEWPKHWNDKIEQNLTQNVSLCVQGPTRKYGGFDLEDFKNCSFQELVTIGKFGTKNPVMIKEIQKEQAKQPKQSK